MRLFAVAAVTAILVMASALAEAALPSVRVLPSALAVEMAQAALSACAANGFVVAVAIVDTAGGLRVLIAADGVRALDIESARRKAVTASALGTPTLQAALQAAASPAYADILLKLNPDLLLVGGGLPILASGDRLGAIGVGGAPGGDKDQSCAQAGLARLDAAQH